VLADGAHARPLVVGVGVVIGSHVDSSWNHRVGWLVGGEGEVAVVVVVDAVVVVDEASRARDGEMEVWGEGDGGAARRRHNEATAGARARSHAQALDALSLDARDRAAHREACERSD